MAVLFSTPGQSGTDFYVCSGATAEAAFEVVGQLMVKLEAIHIAAEGSANVTIEINDGTTDFTIQPTKAYSSGDRETLEFGNPVLRDGYSIKVTDSSSGNVTFAITYTEVIDRNVYAIGTETMTAGRGGA